MREQGVAEDRHAILLQGAVYPDICHIQHGPEHMVSTDGFVWNNAAEGNVVKSGEVVFEPDVESGMNFFA